MSFKEDEMGSNALEFLKDKRELRVHWSLYWANTWPNIVPSLAAFIVETIILPDHDITLDDAWPELFMDHKGRYWEVPESISLNMSSLPSDSGEAPSALMPGLCAKVAFSYEKKKDFWRRKETKEDLIVKTDDGSFWQPSYDTHLKEPHATISGIIGMVYFVCHSRLFPDFSSLEGIAIPSIFACLWEGLAIVSGQMYRRSIDYAFLAGSFAAWFGKDSASAGESQKGHCQFWKLYGDLTRVDARLDICSLPPFAKRVVKSCWFSADSSLSSPRLNLIFQQQVAGSIVCRIDSKLLLDPKSGKGGPHIEDLIYSLSYSFRLLRSGKVVAWFSAKRKEGMIELRLFEF
ncbi:hypothetical protein Gogos_009921 [Gossypium gossypioides]|uniref:Uncharacterized protein n=1 Tax=Gossypium gossypioides TaxID=34282 RepID=A0A7J9BJQ8_GOSGO|nr:hypothetical protein [Gossypium gossypioides]